MKIENVPSTAQTTPRQFAETTFRNRYGSRGFGKIRSWLIVKLYEYQIKNSRRKASKVLKAKNK